MIPVHVTHHRLETDDRLAVDPEIEPEDTVRARMLRPHAHNELIGSKLLDLDAPGQERLALGVRTAGKARPVGEAARHLQIGAERIDLLGGKCWPNPSSTRLGKTLAGAS